MIKNLPERLREQRKNAGLSQRSVARLLHVSPSLISSYESGERTPSVDVLLSISYLYKCSTDYLLGKDARELSETELDVSGLAEEQVKILRDLVSAMKKT